MPKRKIFIVESNGAPVGFMQIGNSLADVMLPAYFFEPHTRGIEAEVAIRQRGVGIDLEAHDGDSSC